MNRISECRLPNVGVRKRYLPFGHITPHSPRAYISDSTSSWKEAQLLQFSERDDWIYTVQFYGGGVDIARSISPRLPRSSGGIYLIALYSDSRDIRR